MAGVEVKVEIDREAKISAGRIRRNRVHEEEEKEVKKGADSDKDEVHRVLSEIMWAIECDGNRDGIMKE